MIQQNTILNVADNSGAKKVLCFEILKKTRTQCLFRGVVKKGSSKFKKSQVVLALVVRAKALTKGLRFSENSCILLKENLEPYGTKISGPIVLSKANPQFEKIVQLTKRNKIFFYENE